MSKVLIAEGLGYSLLSVSQLMAKGIHLEADSSTQEFKLYHGKGGLYIGKAVLKNNVFVLDFVPDLGTADSDGIVTFTSWTHPPDLDPDFSPEGFWYSHTIPETERTRALVTIQHSVAAETTSAAAETSAETSAPTTLTPPVVSSSTASPHIDNIPPTPAQQLTPTPRKIHRSANFTAAFYSNSDRYRPYAPLEKVYSDILYNREPGQGAYSYTITFIDAATRYVWHLNLPSKDMAFEAFIAWLPVAERESGENLKSFQSDGGGEYTSQRFKQFLAEKGIKRLVSLPYAHQQQGVAERLNRTLQNTMRKLLRGTRLPNRQWPEAMDHAVMLHNLLSSSSLPNNASPHLLWTGKQGSTKMLRVFGCMVQYRPPSARAGRFSQRAQWGLHLGIEKNYNAWKIFDVHSKETVAARDVIFYERLTLPTYLANLEENRDPTGGFRGDRHFASAADEADWDEQNVDNASDEAGPLPYCSVPIPMDDENPRESVNTETYFDFVDTGYVTPAAVNTNEAERVGPNFIPDPEDGDEAAYPEDANLPRYTQSGLQILGLVTAVHGTTTPMDPATVQQALGGEHKEKWGEAMDRELKALEERNTWKVVPISVARNKTILTGKWVFRIKTKADGTIEKFKARWVVRGFDQEHGRDFAETFAPVSRHTSLRILLAVAAMKRKKLQQIDVANAFLYAPVDAEIFDVTFDESVPYYRLFPYRTPSLPPPPLFLVPGPPPVDPLPPQGPAPSGVSQVDAVEPVEVAGDSGAAAGAEPGGADSGGAERVGATPWGIEPEGTTTWGAEPRGAESGGATPGGAGSGGATPGGAGPGGATRGGAELGGAETEGAGPAGTVPGDSPGASSCREPLSPQELREWFSRRWRRAAGAGGAAGPGGSVAAERAGATGPGGARTGSTGAAGPCYSLEST
ncbi:unnamed protein product [Closterium sp. NIES-54]